MNPMLATTWDVFGVGDSCEFPSELVHHWVHWVSPFMAAMLASFVHALCAGGAFWGVVLPFGPFKKMATLEEEMEEEEKAKQKRSGSQIDFDELAREEERRLRRLAREQKRMKEKMKMF